MKLTREEIESSCSMRFSKSEELSHLHFQSVDVPFRYAAIGGETARATKRQPHHRRILIVELRAFAESLF